MGGQGEKIGHGAVPSPDAQRGSVGAVRKIPSLAGGALATIAIDLAYHALSDQVRGAVGPDNLPHELVTQYADESFFSITAQDLQIGIADTGQPGADEGIKGVGRGRREVTLEL